MLNNTSIITQGKFKVLVLAVFISVIYDIIWFYLKHAEYTSGSDGSAEIGIRKFSLLMSYASFLLRFLVAIVLWKDAMDFGKIIRATNQSERVVEVEVVHQSVNDKPTMKNLFLRTFKSN